MIKKAVSASEPAPSLEDYTNFHGMLCWPKTAKRCIDSFDGLVLFMPSNYGSATLEKYDRTRPALTVLRYYLLVLISFTGLSTLLKITKFHCARQENAQPITGPIAAESNEDLIADESVWQYIMDQSQTKNLKLTRRFEYSFCCGLISVVMLHITCSRNLLHLVEVYQVKPRPLRDAYSSFFSITC